MRPLGDRVVELFSRATARVVIISPYIKQSTIRRALDNLEAGVTVECFSRWKADDVISGATDLEVWPVLRAIGGSMHLVSDLHAKAYIADEKCLVGSANMTQSGMGWSHTPNVELLVEQNTNSNQVNELLNRVRDTCISVDDDLYATMAHIVAKSSPVEVRNVSDAEPDEVSKWMPRCRFPDSHNLFNTYHDRSDRVLSGTFEDASYDIKALRLPPGIDDERVFNNAVGALLKLTPAFSRLFSSPSLVVSASVGQKLLTGGGQYGNGASGAVTGEEFEVFSQWVTTFIPNTYRQRVGFSGPELVRSVRLA